MTNAVDIGRVPQWEVGDRMRKALQVAKMNGTEMAEYLGVSRETVSTWLNSRHAPNKQTVMLWAMRTGVPYKWLATGEEPSGPDGVHPPGLEPGTHWLRVQPDLDLAAA